MSGPCVGYGPEPSDCNPENEENYNHITRTISNLKKKNYHRLNNFHNISVAETHCVQFSNKYEDMSALHSDEFLAHSMAVSADETQRHRSRLSRPTPQ
ncbi:hypothetical protein Y032_0003g1683 [Ancylostoma ceylanicum]|uniref:Uncharacterized protein n=1 Tax=Ancylostoma ceylanicum TaxID=53326 RepID=A0A016VZ68_9BILA|nr:hypothetical protein Y032_0003g1683 [Ancylostoma ceylanicum]